MAAGGQKFATRFTYEWFCNNLDPVHRIQTKFGMDIQACGRIFYIFLKTEDGRQRSKIWETLYFCGSYKVTGQLYIC